MTEQQKKILVVEDEKPMARALQIKLERAGYTATAVYNGESALDVLASDSFDLIMCDLIMPKVDGFHVLEALRARGNTTPVIIMTNLSQEEDKAKALAMGARDFLVKSNTPIADIVSRVAAIVH